jgi:hypothetical protein
LGKLNRQKGGVMLLIFCAEMEEAKNIKCPDANIYITGVGVCNILKNPKFLLNQYDKVINIGYVGSNKYKTGSVISVSRCAKLITSNIVEEKSINLNPCYLKNDICYTADNFIEHARDEVPMVDMELYYLALLYPQIQSIKIVSDNLDINEHRQTDLIKSWELVNKILEGISNE